MPLVVINSLLQERPFLLLLSVSADLVLKINGTQEKQQREPLYLFKTFFLIIGDYACIVSATANSQTVYDTVYVCVPSTPTSLKDHLLPSRE